METEAPEPSVTIESETSGRSPRLIAMIDYDGREPPRSHPDREAEAAWAVVSALWHPELLARVEELPGIEGVEFPAVPEPREIRVVADAAASRLPADYRMMIESTGTKLIEGGIDRGKIVNDLLRALGDENPRASLDDPLVLDFLALGTAHWMLRDLTTAMNHADCLDHVNMTRETLLGAKAWCEQDTAATASHLRAAFELLTQAREKFYPVDAYMIDLCLVDVGFPAGALVDPLASRTPVTFLAAADAIEKVAAVDPDRVAELRQAINDGWADVVGGTYSEAEEPLAPVTSILWQFLKGSEVYRKHLDDRNVETLATRRFALYPMRPQIARRFGFRFAIHMGFDAGRFPVPRESKRLWESPDLNHLESLMRPPLAADRPSEGLRLPWRLGKSMKDDHVATLPLLHWPSPVAGWYRDLRRVSTYSPVLARWTTIGDYFHMSDRPWETFSPTDDEYVLPYLNQAVARGDHHPITRRPAYFRSRAALDALTTFDALERALIFTPPGDERSFEGIGPRVAADLPFADLETQLEIGNGEQPAAEIAAKTQEVTAKLATSICGAEPSDKPGYLVLNPTGISRRGIIELNDASDDLRTGGPLLAIRRSSTSTKCVVEVPPFGFSWFPKHGIDGESLFGATAEGTTLKNDSMEVEIDRTTGGIRGIKAASEATARLGQQLVVMGLDGSATSTRMEASSVEAVESGPSVAQIRSVGRIVRSDDGSALAAFRQEVTLWAGRPTLDLSIVLEDVDPAWLESIRQRDPWTSYLACRWAWADGKSTLRRTALLSPFPTSAERPETPDALEILTRGQRTTILFGGLAHHKKHGERMLDTILLAGPEVGRRFSLGVVLDVEHAFHAATDFVTPLATVETMTGPPKTGPTGWLVRAESQAVHIPRIEFLERTGDGQGWGLGVYLMETTGRAVRSRLRLFRNPVECRQTDFAGELVIDLAIDGDAVAFDLTPYEMVRLEIRLG